MQERMRSRNFFRYTSPRFKPLTVTDFWPCNYRSRLLAMLEAAFYFVLTIVAKSFIIKGKVSVNIVLSLSIYSRYILFKEGQTLSLCHIFKIQCFCGNVHYSCGLVFWSNLVHHARCFKNLSKYCRDWTSITLNRLSTLLFPSLSSV